MSASVIKTLRNNSESFVEDPCAEDNAELNGVDLVMSLSPNISSSTAIHTHHHLEQHLLRHNIPVGVPPYAASAAATTVVHQNNFSNIHHMQSLHNQHHNSIFNSNHSTPFSVTDILSPIEESYRKLELNCSPPSPFSFSFKRAKNNTEDDTSPKPVCFQSKLDKGWENRSNIHQLSTLSE